MEPDLHRIPADALIRYGAAALAAAGARDNDAQAVAAHLVEANLTGHDSHGIGLLPAYLRHIRDGLVDLKATPEILSDAGAVVRISAHDGWGAPAGVFAVKAGVEKAATLGAAVVTLASAHHLGRIGAYAEQAAAAGYASVHFVNVTDHAPLVAPFGGSDARLGTNPVCVGFPPAQGKPMFLLDMATSRIALGKARVAALRGERVPFGSILDENGLPTDDPAGVAGFEIRGALAPMGDHKGYGLALACELLAGALSGGGSMQPGTPRRGGIQNHMVSIILGPAAFGDPGWIEAEIAAMCAYAQASPPVDWDSHVLIPGDPERALKGKRAAQGIPFDAATLKQLDEAGAAAGLPEAERAFLRP